MREKTLKQSHPPRRQYLAGLVERTELSVEFELHATDAYLTHLAAAASILLNLLDNSHSEERFLAWMNQVIVNPVPDPRRGM